MREFLSELLSSESGFVELRYHNKEFRSFSAEKGRIESSAIKKRMGVGVRVLVDGNWGFSSVGSLEREAILNAIRKAKESAKLSQGIRQSKVVIPSSPLLAVGSFPGPGIQDFKNKSIEEKISLVYDTHQKSLSFSNKLSSVGCGFTEIFEEKSIVTTDGANVEYSVYRPEFRVSASASHDGSMETGGESIGVMGGWDCLFREKDPMQISEEACKTAVDLLESSLPEGGYSTVILSPSIVGLLVHEAIGHTVEADFVLSGSVAQGMIGKRVGSDLVTLCDSGLEEYYPGACGTQPIDDEGIHTEKTVIIQNGILKSYLHNRETAAHFGVNPTGSARSWEYSDLPLIRMRNTYLEPGESLLEDMIKETEDGYFLEGAKNGQADSTGEFMFAVQKAWRIQKGKITGLHKGVTVTGQAFDVLANVDRVSKEFKWDLGSGHCGKGQPAKVDAGGPYIRTKALLGGRSSG
jgi:TldD protein